MKTKKIPTRICVGCGEAKEKRSMIRGVKNADHEIGLDETGKKNGRGAYICKNQACLERALKNKGLERSLKTSMPQEVVITLQEEMKMFETR